MAGQLQQQAWQFLQAGDLRNAERGFSTISPSAARRSRQRRAGLGYVALARQQASDALQRFDRAL